MNSLTTSNHLNLRAALLFDPGPPDSSPQAGVRPDVVNRGRELARRADYPTPAEVEELTRQIIQAIIAASRGAAPGNRAD